MPAQRALGYTAFLSGRLCGATATLRLKRGCYLLTLFFVLSVLLPIGHNSSLLDNLLQHSAHTLAVGGRQLIALVEGARSGQGVAIFHRPIEHVGTRALQAEGAALLGDVLFHKHTQALVAVVYSNGVVLGHCCIVYIV